MMQEDEIFKVLTKQSLNYLLDSLKGSNKNRSSDPEIPLFLVALGVLAFTGAEAIKVIFRKDFGVKGISLFRVILCFLCFLAISIISFIFFLDPTTENGKMSALGSRFSFFITSCIYFIFAFYVLIKGIIENNKAQLNHPVINDDYKGDSYVLDFLSKEGWSRKTIQNIAEPLLMLSVGIFLSGFNWVAGLPLLFCSLSAWIYQLMGLRWGSQPTKMKNTRNSYSNGRFSSYTEVNY